jgi:hypothetical protein
MHATRQVRFSLFQYVYDDSYRMLQDQMSGFAYCALVTDMGVCLYQAHKDCIIPTQKEKNKKINSNLGCWPE